MKLLLIVLMTGMTLCLDTANAGPGDVRAETARSGDCPLLLRHAPNGDWSKSHTSTHMDYRTWNGASWCARICGNTFEHAPNCDWSQSHMSANIDYVTWDGSLWSAQLQGKNFQHAPNGDWSKSHTSDHMNYKTPNNDNWAVKIE